MRVKCCYSKLIGIKGAVIYQILRYMKQKHGVTSNMMLFTKFTILKFLTIM